MQQLVQDFAEALKWIDSSRVPFKNFQPGVGPYGEPQVVKKTLTYLLDTYPDRYAGAKTKRDPDIIIPGRWAIEIKIVRPYGDNGEIAEHWSQNLLHPYEGNVSAIGDALKLIQSNARERKGVLVFTYEHTPPTIDLSVLIECFELMAQQVLRIPLGTRYSAQLTDLVHPVHQQGTVYGWELNISR